MLVNRWESIRCREKVCKLMILKNRLGIGGGVLKLEGEFNAAKKGAVHRTLLVAALWERTLFLALLEAAVHFCPVHHVPPLLQVVAAAVLVFQVVRVLDRKSTRLNSS